MPIREATIPLFVGQLTTRITKMAKFLAVDYPSAYNIILVRLAIHRFKKVPSIYNMEIKISTKRRVETIRANQAESKKLMPRSLIS